MKKVVCIVYILCIAFGTIHSEEIWKEIDMASLKGEEILIQARRYALYEMDIEASQQILYEIPDIPRSVLSGENSHVVLDIPLANGQIEPFYVYSAPIMHPDLAVQYPEIRTYLVQHVQYPEMYGRIDITHKGFHGMIFTPEGTIFIDPAVWGDTEHYIVYNKKDAIQSPEHAMECHVTSNDAFPQDNTWEEDLHVFHQNGANRSGSRSSNGEYLRIYRLAVSATGEYTQFHGGTVSDGLAAIVTTINRVSGVFERDISVAFELVANNNQIVYTNPNTDPFTNPNNFSMTLDENQSSIDNTIGYFSYDIGHVFVVVGGGVAIVQSVCQNYKANGISGEPSPIGDFFDVGFVCHEIGHQLGARHTFNSLVGPCGNNRTASSAYEPGSGSTIMAYTGRCGIDNLQFYTDDYFHAHSLDQMVTYTTQNAGNTCAQLVPTGNAIPEIIAHTPNSHTIPMSTPFELHAEATDADEDELTYCWEQLDLGAGGSPNNPSGNAPLFRTFNPTTSPVRVFPKLESLVNNLSSFGEYLPDYQRNMVFRLTVRDNALGAGAFTNEETFVSVTGNAGPFRVLYPNHSNVVWATNASETVLWDVANTNASPVNCQQVDILLSYDQGYTYPVVLAEDVPNNGSYTISVPATLTSEARVRVQCSNNIFFDVSNRDFEIDVDCNSIDPTINVLESPGDQTICLGENRMFSTSVSSELISYTYQWRRNGVNLAGENASTFQIENAQASDVATYDCEISNGCETITIPAFEVSVELKPEAPSLIFSTNGILLSSYEEENIWYLDGELIPGENDFFYEPLAFGTYTVQANKMGCLSDTSNEVQVLFNSLTELNELGIQIYPNPVHSYLIIEWETMKETPMYIDVYDILGKSILKQSIDQSTNQIDMSTLNNGVYVMKILIDDKTYFHLLEVIH